MQNQGTTTIEDAALRIAAEGGIRYLRSEGLTATTDAFTACLRSLVAIRLPSALDDAKAALDCHMDQVAEQTFTASMVLAGIEAAKESGFPAINTKPGVSL